MDRVCLSYGLHRLARTPLLATAAVAVVLDDAFRAVVIPAVRALAELAPIRRVEARIAGLPPRAILLLFLVPLAVIEPFKIYALYLVGQGRFAAAAAAFVAAKVVGLGLAERLFSIGRDKLLSIPWFAWCHARILAIRSRVHGWLERRRIWRQAVDAVRRMRRRLAAVRLALGRFARRAGRDRPAAARRLARRGRAA
ncbi:MAG TPA: hypothetical protein VK434_00290 [Microvirga sp.]|nr:hypothetical protein [Microvirga sp.]